MSMIGLLIFIAFDPPIGAVYQTTDGRNEVYEVIKYNESAEPVIRFIPPVGHDLEVDSRFMTPIPASLLKGTYKRLR
jgi:hypothetical protein